MKFDPQNVGWKWGIFIALGIFAGLLALGFIADAISSRGKTPPIPTQSTKQLDQNSSVSDSTKLAPSIGHLKWIVNQFESNDSRLRMLEQRPDLLAYAADIERLRVDAASIFSRQINLYRAALSANKGREASFYATSAGSMDGALELCGSALESPSLEGSPEVQEYLEEIDRKRLQSQEQWIARFERTAGSYSQDPEAIQRLKVDPSYLIGRLKRANEVVADAQLQLDQKNFRKVIIDIFTADLLIDYPFSELRDYKEINRGTQ